MDRVFIEDLRIETIIGIYDWERTTRQVVALDIEMAFDNTRPAASDRIADTLDYKAVAKRLIAHVGAARCELVETLPNNARRSSAASLASPGCASGCPSRVPSPARARWA